LLADALEERAAPLAMARRPATIESVPTSRRPDAVVPLSYKAARLLVHATPEAMRDVGDDGTIRLDRATVKWLKRFVSAGDVVYDVNAGIGAYTLLAARQRGAVVVAFEPGHRLHAALCENVLLNACQASVIAVPLTLAGMDGYATANHRRCDGHKPQQVPSLHATRLDWLVECFGLPPANHVRLSVRLPVLEVLEGATRTLAASTLRTVWLHIRLDYEARVTDRLCAAGLQVATRRPRRKTVQLLFRRTAMT
jgi:FkbM family methyltransferase